MQTNVYKYLVVCSAAYGCAHNCVTRIKNLSSCGKVGEIGVELLVNKPSIRMYILMLDTRNVEQTKYVLCTLKNIYSSRCSHIAVHGTGLK